MSHLPRAELVVERLEVAWKCRTQCFIVGTKAVPLISGFVSPLLKLSEGGDGNDAGKPVQKSLKLDLHSPRRLVVSRHTVALNCLEKGCTNAVRMTIVVLQGLVVILTGLEIVGDNCGAMIRENVQDHPEQEEVGVAMHAPAWRRVWRGVRLMSVVCGGVVDERPVAAVILVANDKVEGGEHGREKSLELQEGMAIVVGPVSASERGTFGLVREGKGHLGMGGPVIDRHP